MALERLDKILASQNLGSRKEVGAQIRRGDVTVNGIPVKKPDAKINPEEDILAVRGEPLLFQRYVYYMMNKPGGVLSAARDSRQKTVVDLLPPEQKRRGLFPAGRLDRDTEGLLILTDDGAFAHRMLAPKSGIYKRYEAVLDGPVTPEDVNAFAQGLTLGELDCLSARLEVLEAGEQPRVRVEICEGKFHQVKRMFGARGKNVLYLKRVKIGQLILDPILEPGEARRMTEEEIAFIFV